MAIHAPNRDEIVALSHQNAVLHYQLLTHAESLVFCGTFISVIGIPITVATRRRKVGNATYLEEYRSHRVNGKVVTKFVRYIGKDDSDNKVVESSRIIDRLVPTFLLLVATVIGIPITLINVPQKTRLSACVKSW